MRTRCYAYGEILRAAPTSQPQSYQHRDATPSGGGGVTLTSLFAAANAARTGHAGTVGECPAPRLSTSAEDMLANTTVSGGDSCLGGLDGSPCLPPAAKMTASCAMAMTMRNAERNCTNLLFPKSCVLD